MNTETLSGCTSIRSRAANCLSRFRPDRARWVLVLMLGLWSGTAQAKQLRYHYVSLDQVTVPSGFAFFVPAGINGSGRVYGTLCDDGGLCSEGRIAFYEHGTLTVLPAHGFANVLNDKGTVGGGVLIDPDNFIFQAAIFSDSGVEVIPPQPDEVFAFVIALDDHGTAIIESDSASGEQTFWLHSNGQTTPLDFGPTVRNPVFFNAHILNDRGIIAGTEGGLFTGARGFRLDLHTGQSTLLEPVPGDALAWGLSVNRRGDVLGYSFTSGGPPGTYHERIGVWDRSGQFTTYVDETIVSNRLLFNDHNLIVITLFFDRVTSYLVPSPGVRLNLADLVENLPAGEHLSIISDINNHGNMIGFSFTGGNFLLERTDVEDDDDQ